MAAVSELAVDVGTSAACHTLLVPRASYYRARRAASFPVVCVCCDLRRYAHCSRQNAKRSWRIFTPNASRIARQPLSMRRCSMKGNITVRFEPCIAYWNSMASPANVAISCFIRPTKSPSYWPPLPISSGAGTSASCSDQQNGRTSTCT